MKNKIQEYKEKLQAEIAEITACPVSASSLKTAEDLGRVWLLYDDIWCRLHSYGGTAEKPPVAPMRLTAAEIEEWNATMLNADSTTGGHWTVDQTTELAKGLSIYFEHITPEEWNVTCNMVYSDYVMVARKRSQDNAGFYADIAKAFLFDRDGGEPSKKLCRYYRYIVKAAK